MKKFLTTVLFLFLTSQAKAVVKVPVTISDGSLQSGTTAGFNVSSGTAKDFFTANFTSTGTLTFSGSTFTYTNAVENGTVLNKATNTYSGRNSYDNLVDISTGATQSPVFSVNQSSGVCGTSGYPCYNFGVINGAAPPVGTIGESTEAYVTTSLTTGGFTTMSPMTLNPGLWNISITCTSAAVASATEAQVGWATTTNTNTGHLLGKNAMQYPVSATFDGGSSVAQYLLSPTVATTYFVTGKSFGATIATSCNAVAIRK